MGKLQCNQIYTPDSPHPQQCLFVCKFVQQSCTWTQCLWQSYLLCQGRACGRLTNIILPTPHFYYQTCPGCLAMQTSTIWLEWYLRAECVFSPVQWDICLKEIGVECLKSSTSSKLCCQSNLNLIWSDHSKAQTFREMCCSPNVTALITWRTIWMWGMFMAGVYVFLWYMIFGKSLLV